VNKNTAPKSTCRNCGRAIQYGYTELCQKCKTYINNDIRRQFRRNPNEFTQRADIKKRYRIP
jgi:predicted nucleic acid-binding Zn ribbon protein